MSEHTPGPWVCETFGAFPTITTDSPDYPNQTVADTCASISIFHVSGREDNHAEANARLIAAAPELLIALIDAVTILDRLDTLRHQDSKFPVLDAARTAIAKARGEQS